ncbi:Type I restriction-modification system, DNA-methyltransferase subunit M [Methanosarcina siciliae T4/M]|uniref:site-specific DNA-methyltransferase (adenine-specific) n=2 Tax=Methanosarcina siciliae TaxID=38027 RepID=A0A0E3PE32_9EURY|nr:N-6 DNA methylase [Methanosarcina siciliae]AKB28444.1 Type I restriction-modification system, DNA-methyltransferase subunit M [Methanosarcina siciliae T4/M]AKB32354.1 Type I restriction-modification system, DNA-methyltransferase subunit M [Methanosarcina siciliae HI350]
MIFKLVNPDINDRICDPACGTAGFLFTACRYILKKYTSPDMVKALIFDSTMVRIALMNMVLHGNVRLNHKSSPPSSNGESRYSKIR